MTFTMQCLTSVTYAVVICLSISRPPVCRPPVCPSHAGIVPKWLNVGSHKQHRMITKGLLVFWCQRSWQNSNGVTPNRGTK